MTSACWLGAGLAVLWLGPGVLAKGPMKKEEPMPAAPAQPAAPGAVKAPAKAGAAPDLPAGEGMTAQELLAAGQAAYGAGDFAKASALLERFLKDYTAAPEAAAAVAAVKPMVAVCRLRRGEFEAARPLIAEALALPKLDAKSREELWFWQAICEMKAGEIAKSQDTFGRFWQEKTHDPARRDEALLLFGTGFVMLEQWTEAADFFRDQVPKLRPQAAEVAGRARVLQLHALLQAGRREDALGLIRELYPRMGGLTQLAGFQSLTLELGSAFLEEQKFYEAIQCLQRLWPKVTLLAHQAERAAELRRQRESLVLRRAPGELVYQLDNTLARLDREVAQFEKVEDFDASVRLRLAQAYIGLGRHREAALVLEHMLVSMEPTALVEQAAVALIQSWLAIERWPKAVETADVYLEKFGQDDKADSLPAMRYLKGEALRGQQASAEAAALFHSVAAAWPDQPLARRALFLEGICHLEQDKTAEAVAAFKAARAEDAAAVPVKKSRSKKKEAEPASKDDAAVPADVVEDAFFWEGMAWSFAKEHEKSRDQMTGYLERWPEGRSVVEAKFRHAFSVHALGDFPASIKEWREFLKAHADSPLADEARLLLGDALGDQEQVEEAVKEWRQIGKSGGRMHVEAVFKIGKALKLLDQPEEMRKHFESFVAENPGSPRVAEAVHAIGVSWAKEGKPVRAKEVYWRTIREQGPDPEARGVEVVLLALKKLYPGADGRKELEHELDKLRVEAEGRSQVTLQVRALWARAQLVKETAPGTCRAKLQEAAVALDPEKHSARILVEAAEAAFESGNERVATGLWDGVLKWHPRAAERDLVIFGQARLAAKRGQRDEALRLLDSCEAASVHVSLTADLRLERARLLRTGKAAADLATAKTSLEQVLGAKTSTPRQKAAAALEMARLMIAQGDEKGATAWFERVYVAYARQLEFVADALWERGQLLEKMGNAQAAKEVYLEAARRKDVQTFESGRKAAAKAGQ